VLKDLIREVKEHTSSFRTVAEAVGGAEVLEVNSRWR
jgi:hypothetical protein